MGRSHSHQNYQTKPENGNNFKVETQKLSIMINLHVILVAVLDVLTPVQLVSSPGKLRSAYVGHHNKVVWVGVGTQVTMANIVNNAIKSRKQYSFPTLLAPGLAT